ncbi:unnamed protein product [Mucor hiemalis]
MTITKIITQVQAFCMFFGMEFNNDNVTNCKRKVPWAIMGYDSDRGDQVPLILTAEHFCRHSIFIKFAENKKQEVVVKDEQTGIRRKAGRELFWSWSEVIEYVDKVYKSVDAKDARFVQTTIETHEIFEIMCVLVHPTLKIGNTWKAFQQECNSRQADFCLAESKRGTTSHARMLYVLKDIFRGKCTIV